MLYDLSNLRKLSDNDETFIIEMLETYMRTAPPILQRMEEYGRQQKYEAAGREAHKLIPGISFLGAKSLQSVLVSIEEKAKNGQALEEMPALIANALTLSSELISCFRKDFPEKLQGI